MRNIRKSPQNAPHKVVKSHLILLSFLSPLARVGLIASTFILLVMRFQLDALSSALVTVSLQGATIFTKTILRRFLSKYTARKVLLFGSYLGASSAILLSFLNNFNFFVFVLLVASLSKIAFETSLPLLSHKHFEHDKSFASRFIGSAQGGTLAISAIIAILMFIDKTQFAIFVTAGAYLAIGVMIHTRFLVIEENQISDKVLSKNRLEKSKGSFQCRTLAFADLSINIIGGMSACLMPVVFKTVSHVSQGTDSILCFIFGAFAFIAGTKLIPVFSKKFVLSAKDQWVMFLVSVSVTIITSMSFTTYYGVKVAFFGAALNGLGFSFGYSALHSIAAQELDKSKYQLLLSGMCQRAAYARIISPVALGALSKILSITALMGVAACIVAVLGIVLISRVNIVINAINANIKADNISELAIPTSKSFSGVDRRRKTFATNYDFDRAKLLRRYNSARTSSPSFNRIRDYSFELRRVASSSQTYADMVATWRSHRFRRDTSLCSAA